MISPNNYMFSKKDQSSITMKLTESLYFKSFSHDDRIKLINEIIRML